MSSTLSVQTRWGTVRVEVADDGRVTVHNPLSVDAIYPCWLLAAGDLGFHVREGDILKSSAICVQSWVRHYNRLEITVKPERAGGDGRFTWQLGHPVILQVTGSRPAAKEPQPIALPSFVHISALCFPTGQNVKSVDLLREPLFPVKQDI